MPTTTQSKNYAEVPVAEHNRVIHRISKDDTGNLPVTLGLNDVVQFFKMPEIGFKLLGASLEVTDIDSNGTPLVTLSVIVTNGTTTYTPILSSTVGQAGGLVGGGGATTTGGSQTGWLGKVCKGRGWYVAVKCTAAAATAVAGTAKVGISYTLDIEGGE